jgi:hypothetical protein
VVAFTSSTSPDDNEVIDGTTAAVVHDLPEVNVMPAAVLNIESKSVEVLVRFSAVLR